MKFEGKTVRWTLAGLFGAFLFGTLPFLTGCQLSQNGQTLPSPYYLDNKIQYFPSGNEFQYQQEVDRMKREQVDRDMANAGVWQRDQQQ